MTHLRFRGGSFCSGLRMNRSLPRRLFRLRLRPLCLFLHLRLCSPVDRARQSRRSVEQCYFLTLLIRRRQRASLETRTQETSKRRLSQLSFLILFPAKGIWGAAG